MIIIGFIMEATDSLPLFPTFFFQLSFWFPSVKIVFGFCRCCRSTNIDSSLASLSSYIYAVPERSCKLMMQIKNSRSVEAKRKYSYLIHCYVSPTSMPFSSIFYSHFFCSLSLSPRLHSTAQYIVLIWIFPLHRLNLNNNNSSIH